MIKKMMLLRKVKAPRLSGSMKVRAYGRLVMGEVPRCALVISATPKAQTNRATHRPP